MGIKFDIFHRSQIQKHILLLIIDWKKIKHLNVVLGYKFNKIDKLKTNLNKKKEGAVSVSNLYVLDRFCN